MKGREPSCRHSSLQASITLAISGTIIRDSVKSWRDEKQSTRQMPGSPRATSKDFMAGLDRFDVIFDAVGKSSFVNCRPLLAAGGTYVTTLPTPSLFFRGGVQSIAGIFRNAKRAKGILVRPSGKDLAYLCQLADEGKLRPTVSLTLSLDRAAEAHEASEAGHTRGKIVLEV
jgi:NADPH:quinone reductase-like Zn-dependent oxidoreductase